MIRRGLTAYAGALLIASACAAACGSGTTARHSNRAPAARLAAHSVMVRFGAGRGSASFRLREPDGVILLYRLRAPVGTSVRGVTRLPSVSAPLSIATTELGPSSSCRHQAGTTICTVAMEWCPMPAGTWHIRLRKVAGPAGNVTLVFRVGQPPRRA